MSIRNKRLLKEIPQLDKFKLKLPTDWLNHDIVVIKTIHHPKLFVHQKKKIDYIEWFLKIKHTYKDMESLLHIPCMCCKNIICDWSPAYGIESIIQDFLQFQEFFTILGNFRIIYKKINFFDDLIYKNIISYLYNG